MNLGFLSSGSGGAYRLRDSPAGIVPCESLRGATSEGVYMGFCSLGCPIPQEGFARSRTGLLATPLLILAASLVLPRTVPAQVDPNMSYFVPQIGPVAAPVEGAGAIKFFTQCPNNDVAALIDNNARIKVVVKDATGAPIAGINVTRIVIELNGGTPAQGFGGNGADSVIANHDFNQNPPCPDLRPIYADAPTDAAGVTYITFAGSAPGAPGVAVRSELRKWR